LQGYHGELREAETIGVLKIGAPQFVIVHTGIVTNVNRSVRY
jgi:hypothetical protein